MKREILEARINESKHIHNTVDRFINVCNCQDAILAFGQVQAYIELNISSLEKMKELLK